MKQRVHWWLLVGLMLLGRVGAGVEKVPAVVELSDGSALSGTVYIPTDRFYLFDPDAERRYSVRITEIKSLENRIERQSMEEKWMFRESGLDDKVYLGRYYPVRYYRTNITFQDGRRLSGNMVAKTLYVETEEARHRFILRRKHEGEEGEDLTDLVYVRSIAFGEGGGVRGTVEGTLHIPRGETLKRVLLINRDSLFSVNTPFNARSGHFRSEGCTEGRYDIVAVTDKAIYTYFSREKDEEAARLHTGQVATIQAWADKLRDFFHSQRIVYGAGNAERAFVLVFKERRGGTTLRGLERLHRYDVWAMHRPKEQWQILKRFYIWRTPSEKADVKPLDIVALPSLGGYNISEGNTEIVVDAELRRTEEPLIPPPPPPEEEDKEDGDRG